MKKVLFLLMAGCLLSFTECKINLGNKIEPSKKIVKVKYPQKAFDKIDNRVVGTIRVVQSDQSRVTLSAPENYIDLFKFKNDDGELEIDYKKNNVNIEGKNVVIVIYTPTLSEISNSGVADIHLDNLVTDEFEIKNSGVGSFNLSQVKARKIEVSCSGVGSITINGQTDKAEYSCSGVGDINAKDMISRVTEASVSGVGGIDCYASESIKGRVSGVGGLKYAGHPAKKDLDRSMVGGITEL